MALLTFLAILCGLACNVCSMGPVTKVFEIPVNFTQTVGNKISQNADIFYFWGYGGALIFDGLWQANQAFGTPYETQLNGYPDMFTADKGGYGYKILHGIKVPYGDAVGDTIGLFPITI